MLVSGFTHTPVSKFLVGYVVISSLVVTLTDSKYMFPLTVAQLFRGQWWRMITWQASYLNSTEVIFAALTFYHLRAIERLWGSRKFASFLLATLPYTALLPPLVLAVLLRPASFGFFSYLPAGPTAILFAVLAQFHAVIPYTYKYRIGTFAPPRESHAPQSARSLLHGTVTLTSKTMNYVLPFQLALAQLPGSLVPAAVGWAVGYAYRNEVLPRAGGWRVPAWVVGEKAKARSEGFEGLRRRLEGEAAGATSGREGGNNEVRRRTLGNAIGGLFGVGGNEGR